MLTVSVPNRHLAMRVVLVSCLVAVLASGCRGEILKQFEYDEDLHLSLGGSATLYVNASIPALVALRGAPLDLKPSARFERDAIRAFFTSAVTSVTRVSSSRRHGRRFAHVRIEVSDVRRLGTVPAFSWTTIRLERMGDLYRYRQDTGASVNGAVSNVGWTGGELVAFRLHLPSKIAYHNAGAENMKRGNILVWEQSFADRLAGKPLAMEARMESTSILYRTLWLFLGSMAAAFATLALIVWWVVKRGKGRIADAPGA